MNSLSDILSNENDDVLNKASESVPHDEMQQEEVTPPSSPSSSITPPASSPADISQLKAMLYTMKDQLDAMIRVVNGETVKQTVQAHPEATALDTGERIIEGVFNGEKMVGADGHEYPVPPNYASKSKLVEGDMMKLTITNQGRFIYKQISQIERKRLVGELVADPATSQWSALAEGKTYKILTASVTFYKGKAGDEVVFMVPTEGDSSWGAVENIINK